MNTIFDQNALRWKANTLFNKGWFAVGFVKDLPQPGSALPVNYFNNPLLIVRSKQDENIRVFQNVCRHRGMILN